MELIFIPIILGLAAAFSGKQSRWVALFGSLAALVLVVLKLKGFHADGSFQYLFDQPWFSKTVRFSIGIDGITMIMLLLTNIMTPLIVFSVNPKGREFNATIFGLIVAMQGALNGVFLATDGLMFYIFWELALIPVYFICAMWGEGDRFKTTLKFFIYTFVGSLAMLASLLYLYSLTPEPGNFSYKSLVDLTLTRTEAIWVGAGLLLAFAVKIPLLPFSTWQPDTYTEAPAPGTMLLSGIMLKMGIYGLIRWFFPLVPEAYDLFSTIIIIAGVVGVLYGALIAIRQDDMKRLVAFSSLSHVGLIAAGIATLSADGMKGAVLQMFTHGVNVVGLFLAIDIIQSRAGTRSLSKLGGIAKQAPLLAVGFLIVVLGTTAVPFTNGFPGELLLLKSVFAKNTVWGVLAGITIILCAVYMLRMYQFSMLGKEKNGIYLFPDLSVREMIVFAVIVVLVIAVGFYPQWILDISGPSVKRTMDLITNTAGVLS